MDYQSPKELDTSRRSSFQPSLNFRLMDTRLKSRALNNPGNIRGAIRSILDAKVFSMFHGGFTLTIAGNFYIV
jgi:hypothetical protein